MNAGHLVGGLALLVLATALTYMARHPEKDPFYDAFSDEAVRFLTFGGTRADWHLRFRIAYAGGALLAVVAAIIVLVHV